MSIIEQHHELVAKKVIENLKKRHMTGYYCKTPEEAVSLASSLIKKGSSVSWGGTMTISEIGMMDAKSAAKIMYEGSDAATINEKAAEYATLQNNVTSAARRGYVDTIIEPEDTRKYVIGAFEMLYTKREDRPDRKHGTV